MSDKIPIGEVGAYAYLFATKVTEAQRAWENVEENRIGMKRECNELLECSRRLCPTQVDAEMVSDIYNQETFLGDEDLGDIIMFRSEKHGTQQAINGQTERLDANHFLKALQQPGVIGHIIEERGFLIVRHSGKNEAECQAFADYADETYAGLRFHGNDRVAGKRQSMYQQALRSGTAWMFIEFSSSKSQATAVLMWLAMRDLLEAQQQCGRPLDTMLSHSITAASIGDTFNEVGNEDMIGIYRTKQAPETGSLDSQERVLELSEETVASFGLQALATPVEGSDPPKFRVPSELHFSLFMGNNTPWKIWHDRFGASLGLINT